MPADNELMDESRLTDEQKKTLLTSLSVFVTKHTRLKSNSLVLIKSILNVEGRIPQMTTI